MADIFDTHAHYCDAAFDADRDAVLPRLAENGVCAVIDCGITLPESKKSIALAEKYSFVFAAAGIHPENINEAAESDLYETEKLLTHPKVVAIGEIGLDYHWDTPRDKQKFYFDAQLEMAVRHNMPVIIHDRDAHADTLAALRRCTPKGVLHCYSGSAETALELLPLGFYFGFGGALTFKNNQKARRAAEAIPLDRLLLETDCPYMAPVPFRGKRCDSSLIKYTAAVLAEIKGVSDNELLKTAKENAERLFGVKV